MATGKPSYGAVTAMTITVASLADGAARESTFVDNTTGLWLDAALAMKFKLQAGSPAGDKVVNIYVYGSVDEADYQDNASGADAGISLRSPTNLVLVATLQCPDAGALSYKGAVGSIAPAFGGVLPARWGVVIENRTGLTFDTTGGNHYLKYRGVRVTVS